MTTYTCAKCGKVLPVVNGAPQRACKCDAPIIADIKAHATGAGSMAKG